MATCWRAKLAIIAAEPHRATLCIEHLRRELCSSGACAGRAYWTITAYNNCLVKLLPEFTTPKPSMQQPIAYSIASITVECSEPEQLVRTIKGIVESVERCQGIQIKPQPDE